MTTIRASIEATVASLEAKLKTETATISADIATEKMKLEGLHPNFAALLDHPVDEVVAFFRSMGAHLFPKASPAAIAGATAAPAAPAAAASDSTAASTPAAPAAGTAEPTA